MEIKEFLYQDIPGPKSRALLDDRDKFISRSLHSSLYGIGIKAGEGNYICDVDDNWYLDLLSGAAVANIGYCRRDLLKIFTDASERLHFSCSSYTPTLECIELSEELIRITPGDFPKKVGFGLSGSDAIDGAIRMTRKYKGNKYVIAFKDSYHGSIGCAAQATNVVDLVDEKWRDPFTIHLDMPKTEGECYLLETKLRHLHHDCDIASILIEPIQGDGGIVVPLSAPLGFFDVIERFQNKYDVPIIVDEIQSGMGRTGKWWAIEHFGITPDILVTAKSLTNGISPLSAIVGRKEIVDCLEKVEYLFTYSAHPPTCAVAKKVISAIDEEKLRENAAYQGNLFKNKMMEFAKENDLPSDFVRGIGLMLGLKLNDGEGKIIGTRCTERGLYPGFVGRNADVLRIEPPLTISTLQMHSAIDKLQRTLMERNNMPSHILEKVAKYSRGLAK